MPISLPKSSIDMLDPNAFLGMFVDARYCLRKFLGNGAFGFVFAADEMALGEQVGNAAVKLIRPQNDAHHASVLHEIRAMASLSHPHLLGYRSSGEIALPSGEKIIFLALELADDSLESCLERGQMTYAQISEMANNIANALAYLQNRGVVHRDLKPANILRAEGSWKIADFGLARLTAQTHQTAAAGTLSYMSPDAIDGEISAAGDVWAFGVMLQECLTGRFPYPHASQLSFIRHVAQHEPFIAPAMPQPFDEIVRGCLTKDAKTRWTAQRVLDALQQKPRQNITSLPIAPAVPVATARPAPQNHTVVLPRQSHEPIVDASGNGTHRNLTEALSASPKSARIWIRPGIYRESLLLERDVEILGDGGREQILVECGIGNCLKIAAGSATLRGLTLIGVAKTMNKKYHAVSVSGGTLTLDDCIVSSDSLACVAVQGRESSTRLVGCLIARGSKDGVLFSGGASGTIEHCQISGHAGHGVHIKDDASPILRECVISGNQGCGVFIQGAQAIVQNCEIQSNHKSGVHIGESSETTLSDRTISDNRQQAIDVERGARGTVSNCDLRRNVFGAWALTSGSSLQRYKNKEG